MRESSFNPSQRFSEAKMQPREYQAEALERFHRERIDQKEAIALIGGEVLDTIFAQPDITLSELENLVLENSADARLSSQQMDIAKSLIKAYGKRRKRLEDLRSKDLTPKEQLKSIAHLNKPLTDREVVHVDWRTFVVHFVVSPDTYSWLSGSESSLVGVGFFDPRRWDYATFANGSRSSNEVAEHEEQHAMYHLVREVLKKKLKKTLFQRPFPRLEDFEHRLKHEGPYRPAKEFIDQYIYAYSDRIKDEIFAYTCDGDLSPSGVTSVLLKSETSGGLYDYFLSGRRDIEEILVNSGRNNETIAEVVQMFTTKHREVVKEAVASIRELIEKEGYTFHQAFIFLMDVPLELWAQEIKRLQKR